MLAQAGAGAVDLSRWGGGGRLCTPRCAPGPARPRPDYAASATGGSVCCSLGAGSAQPRFEAQMKPHAIANIESLTRRFMRGISFPTYPVLME